MKLPYKRKTEFIETNFSESMKIQNTGIVKSYNLTTSDKNQQYEKVKEILTSGLPELDIVKKLINSEEIFASNINEAFSLIRETYEYMKSDVSLDISYNINVDVARFDKIYHECSALLDDEGFDLGENQLVGINFNLVNALDALEAKQSVLSLGVRDKENVERIARSIAIENQNEANIDLSLIGDEREIKKLYDIFQKIRKIESGGIKPLNIRRYEMTEEDFVLPKEEKKLEISSPSFLIEESKKSEKKTEDELYREEIRRLDIEKLKSFFQ